MNKKPVLVLAALFILYNVWFLKSGWTQKPTTFSSGTSSSQRIWQYQCIDTMKTSRDKARTLRGTLLDEHIASQMQAISALGANCVAIDTPYDNEFLPVLKKWVAGARKYKLHIWFRGNFSSWEGWFDYPKGMTTAQHLQKTNAFIATNKDLFADGDIFTPAPEAENGGPFNQVEIDEYSVFREYLIQEYQEAKKSFEKIGKHVTVNWLSMNGGLAKRMLDQKTVDALGGVVAIDHYIKTPQEMGEFIRYFHDKFAAKVVIGEWGAPIPEINGVMTDKEQGDFIRALLDEQYRYKNIVNGTNYWVLYDSSTALTNSDGSARPATDALSDYFRPSRIEGTVSDTFGRRLKHIPITLGSFEGLVYTDDEGKYSLITPSGNVRLSVDDKEFHPFTKYVHLKRGTTYKMDLTIIPSRIGFFTRIYYTILGHLRF